MSPNELVAQSGQYLSFEVAGEEYALPILRIREIVELRTITPVPSLPPYIRGVVNLRGSAVPILDLAAKLGLPASTPSKRTCFIIVEWQAEDETFQSGIMADAVRYVIDLAGKDVEPPPQFGTRIDTSFLAGMARVEDRFALILDIDRILKTQGVIAAGRAAAEVEAPEDAEHAEAVEVVESVEPQLAESSPEPETAKVIGG